MEDSEEYKWALKIVIKRQMRGLIDQLRESGEEIAIIAANVKDGSCSHFGSPNGDWFMSEQRNITSSFLNFCKSQAKKKRGNVQNFAETSFNSSSVDVFDTVVMPTVHSKQKGSSKTMLKVSVPQDLAFGTTDEELAGLVGRILVSKLTGSQDKGNSGGSMEGVKRTRSGRAVNSSFKTTLIDFSEDGTETKSNIRGHLTELSQHDLKRFEVCTEFGTTVNLQSVYVTTQQLDLFDIPVVQALSKLSNINKLEDSRNKVKIVVLEDSVRDTVHIDVEEHITDNAVRTLPDNDNSTMEQDLAVSDGEDILAGSGDDSDYVPPKRLKIKKENVTPTAKAEKVTPAAITEVSGTPGKALSLRIGQKEEKIQKHRRKRNSLKQEQVSCPHCGTSLAGKSSLYTHINRVHLKLRNHKCKICTKAFYHAYGLETHMVTVHTRKCESCKEYLVESVPWQEEMTASTPREVTCQCGAYVTIYSKIGAKGWNKKKANDNINISKSAEMTTEKHKYACGVCGRLFMEKKDCEKHGQSHSSVKNWVCELCGTMYKNKVNLIKHRFTEHGVYCNKCEVCNKNCCSAISLKVHMSKAHGTSQSGTLARTEHVEQAEVETNVGIVSEILDNW